MQTKPVSGVGSPHASVRACLAALTAIISAAWITSTAATAQVIVVQSTAKNLPAGKTLSNDQTVTIPAGKRAIFILPSGATRTITGPFNDKAAALTRGIKSNPSLIDAVKQYVETGGATKKTVGAMRSLAPSRAYRSPTKQLPFSWRAVPVDASGDICVEKDAAITLVRNRTAGEQTITIVDMKSQLRVPVIFASGTDSTPWPADLELDPKATYAILIKDQPLRQLRMRLIAPLPAREDTLQVLHGQRCSNQFRAFIREMQNAG